jgi:hypothetical protein
MMGSKRRGNQHEWDYQGWDEELKTEYSNCALCGGWRANSPDGIKKITHKQYLERLNIGKVVIRG